MKKLALVLGGGATKGYAHIGVLKVLEEKYIIGFQDLKTHLMLQSFLLMV